MEDKKEEKINILNGIYSQISSFDNKSSILISVIGIVFAISLNFLSIFQMEQFINSNISLKVWYYIFFFLFCAVSFASILSFVMVIIPRSDKRAKNSPNYYKNISNMSIDEISIAINEKSNEYLLNQIKINADLCMKKHKWLMVGIYLLIPFSLTISVLIIFISCVFWWNYHFFL